MKKTTLRILIIEDSEDDALLLTREIKRSDYDVTFKRIDTAEAMPEDVDFRNTDSLGLHLVNILAEDQLHGSIKLDRKKGTSFRIRFKGKK